MNNKIAVMKYQVDMNVIKSDVDDTGTVGGNGGRNDRAALYDALFPHFNLIFTTSIVVKVVFTSTIHNLVANSGICHHHTSALNIYTVQCIGNSASVQLAAMIFGKVAKMRKAVIEVGTSKEEIKPRKLVILSLICNAQDIRFSQFEVSGNDLAYRNANKDTPVNAVGNVNLPNKTANIGLITQTSSVQPGVIRTEHVEI